MTLARQVSIKRIYAEADEKDGCRILVDRLWPRGMSRARAALACWAKDVAPSNELRRWFGHDPEKWPEFGRRYRDELKGSQTLEKIRALARTQTVTLLYAARDEEHNEAVVLRDLLNDS